MAAFPAWTITGTETYEGTPLVVATDVMVASGGTLRLVRVDATWASAPGRELTLTVAAGGTLEVLGGNVSGAWPFELRAEPGANVLVSGARVENARLVLRADNATVEGSRLDLRAGPVRVTEGAPVLRGTTLEGSPSQLALVEGGVLTIQASTLRGSGGEGAWARGGTLVVEDSRIEQNQGYGVRVDGARLVLEGSRIEDGTEYGLFASGADVVVRDNVWRTECAVFLVEGTRGLVAGNVFEPEGRGVTLYASDDVVLRKNAFRGAQQALYLIRSDARVERNEFEGNGRGAVVSQSSPAFDRNRFAGNAGGVEVWPAPGSAPVLRNNSFEAEGFAVSTPEGIPVDARWNWWGSPDGPGGTVLGPVLVDPWLTAPHGRR